MGLWLAVADHAAWLVGEAHITSGCRGRAYAHTSNPDTGDLAFLFLRMDTSWWRQKVRDFCLLLSI